MLPPINGGPLDAHSVNNPPGNGGGLELSVKNSKEGLSRVQLRALVQAFKKADLNYDGVIDAEEIKLLLEDMGYMPNEEDVKHLVDHMDSDGDKLISQKEFVSKAGGEELLEAIVRDENIMNFVELEAPQDQQLSFEDAVKQCDSDLINFFQEHNIQLEALSHLARKNITLDNLVEYSYDPHDLNDLTGQMRISREGRNRLAHVLNAKRMRQLFEGDKICLVICVGDYTDRSSMVTPGHADEDGERMVKAVLEMGFGVYFLHSNHESAHTSPTAENILDAFNAVKSSLLITSKSDDPFLRQRADKKTVWVHLMGNVLQDDKENYCLLPEDYRPGMKIPDQFGLRNMLNYLKESGNTVALTADFAGRYQLGGIHNADTIYTGNGFAVLGAECDDRRGQFAFNHFDQPNGGGLMTYHCLQACQNAGQEFQFYNLCKHVVSKIKSLQDQLFMEEPVVQFKLSSKPVHIYDDKARILVGCQRLKDDEDPKETFEGIIRERSWTNMTLKHAHPTGRLVFHLEGDWTAEMKQQRLQQMDQDIVSIMGGSHCRFSIKPANGYGDRFLCMVTMDMFRGEVSNTSMLSNMSNISDLNTSLSASPKKKKAKAKQPKQKLSDREKRMKREEKSRILLLEASMKRSVAKPGSHLYDKWVAMIEQYSPYWIGSTVGGLKIIGWYREVELDITCTAKEAEAMECAVKEGGLSSLGVHYIRSDFPPVSTTARPGTLASAMTGTVTSGVLKVAWRQNESEMARICFPTTVSKIPGELMGPLRAKFRTIKELQEIINQASSRVIELPAGTYPGHLQLAREGVTIRGIGEVIIQSTAQPGPVVCIKGNLRLENIKIQSSSQIEFGISIEHGSPELDNISIHCPGGGIKIFPQCSPIIKNTTINSCIHGPGIHIERATPELHNVETNGNALGAVATGKGADPLLIGCTILHSRGAGMVVEEEANCRLWQCSITQNACPGILLEKGHVHVWGCHIWKNKGCGISITDSSTGRIENSLLSGNATCEIELSKSYGENVIRRNQFYRDTALGLCDAAISVSSAHPLIERNQIDGYRIGILLQAGIRGTLIVNNTACCSTDPDSYLMRDSSGKDNMEKDAVRLNQWYVWQGGRNGEKWSAERGPNPHNIQVVYLEDMSLYKATCLGHNAVVRQLLLNNVNVNALDKESKGTPALMAAIREEDKIMVTLLLEMKANPNQTDRGGWAPLHVSIYQHNSTSMQMLLDAGADPTLPTNDGTALTPALVAVDANNQHALQLLLEEYDVDVNTYFSTGLALIHVCARFGRIDLMQLLCKCGADVNQPAHHSHATPIYIAAQTCCIPLLQWLIEQEANLSVPTAEKDYPLWVAIRLGNIQCVKILVEAGAPLDMKTENGATILHQAAQGGKIEIVRYLLTKVSQDVKLTTDRQGHTALHSALIQGNTKVAALLLQQGFPKDVPDMHGRYPVHYADRAGLDLLLELNEIKLYNNARWSDAFNSFEKQIQRDKELVNHRNLHGTTLYMHAVIFGNRRVASYLLERGASFSARDSSDVSAVAWATFLHADAMLNNLEMYGATKQSGRDRECLFRLENGCHDVEDKVVLKMHPGWVTTMFTKAPDNWILMPNSLPPVINLSCLGRRMADSLDGWTYDLTKTNIPQSTEFQEGETCFNHLEWLAQNSLPQISTLPMLLWDARFAAINHVMCEESVSALSALCIHLFTADSPVFSVVQKSIKEGNQVALELWAPFFHHFYRAVASMPEHLEECYIVAPQLIKPFPAYEASQPSQAFIPLQPFQVGTQLTMPGFTFATSDVKNAKQLLPEERGILFMVSPTTARDISQFSCHPQNAEILFNSGTVFEVTEVHELDDPKWRSTRKYLVEAAKEPGSLPTVVVKMKEASGGW